jgi:hypothetical protein
MSIVLIDLVECHIWCPRVLIDFRAGLDSEQQRWSAGGPYGDIRSALEYLVDSGVACFRHGRTRKSATMRRRLSCFATCTGHHPAMS